MTTQDKLDLLFTGQQTILEALKHLEEVPEPSCRLKLIEATLKCIAEMLDADIHAMNTQFSFEFMEVRNGTGQDCQSRPRAPSDEQGA